MSRRMLLTSLTHLSKPLSLSLRLNLSLTSRSSTGYGTGNGMVNGIRTLRLKAPTLQNTGSTARDHLASERTYLSWLRTGLGFVALGIAVERFSQFELELGSAPLQSQLGSRDQAAASQGEDPRTTTARMKRTQEHVAREQVLVGALLGTGVGCIAYGAARYFSTLALLEKGLFQPAVGGAGALGVAVGALAGCAWWGMVREEREGVAGRRTG